MDYEKERKSVSSREREMQIYGKNWEELRGLVGRGILVEVEHLKAHRTKKEKENMSHFEKCVTEGNEKADDRSNVGRRIHGRSKDQDNVAGKR